MVILKCTEFLDQKKLIPYDWTCNETCTNFSNRRQVPGTPQSEKSHSLSYSLTISIKVF